MIPKREVLASDAGISKAQLGFAGIEDSNGMSRMSRMPRLRKSREMGFALNNIINNFVRSMHLFVSESPLSYQIQCDT